jgi:hypothetical protein
MTTSYTVTHGETVTHFTSLASARKYFERKSGRTLERAIATHYTTPLIPTAEQCSYARTTSDAGEVVIFQKTDER